jgi:hypothetical protein
LRLEIKDTKPTGSNVAKRLLMLMMAEKVMIQEEELQGWS